MRLNELFKDARIVETTKTVWRRRDHKLSKQVVRQQHELAEIKPYTRFPKREDLGD